MTAALLIIGAALLVSFGGLMASLDAALSVTSRNDLSELSIGARSGAALRRIADDIDAHVNAVVFFRILVETAAAVLVTAAFMILFDNVWWAIAAAAVLMTGVSFVLVGASPRAVGRRNAKPLLRVFAPIVRFVRILLGPLASALASLGQRVTPGGRRSAFTSEEQLLSLVDEAADADLIEDDDRELIHSVFDFTDRYVRAIMVPRTDLVTLEPTVTSDEAMGVFLSTGVSRIPVIDTEDDDVIGVLYLKDLIQAAYTAREGWGTRSLAGGLGTLLRPPVFVPESMRAETLLQQMKRDAVHVCIVVDEYGGISGLVTLEDLLEELVGEISDEYDAPAVETAEIAPGRYRVNARLSLDELGDLFGLDLEDDDVETVGGLLAKALGRVPQAGAQAEYDGIVMIGGTSLGRGRGISTVIVEASDDLKAAREAFEAEDEQSEERSSRRRGRKEKVDDAV